MDEYVDKIYYSTKSVELRKTACYHTEPATFKYFFFPDGQDTLGLGNPNDTGSLLLYRKSC